MHRVPLLLVLGLLLSGPAAPARLGPKRVSVPNPGVAFLKQTLCCSQGLLGSDCSGGTRLLRLLLYHLFWVQGSSAIAPAPGPGSQSVTRCITHWSFPLFSA